MKKFILAALLCTVSTITTQAQVTDLNINRETACDTWLEFLGSDGSCTVTHTTGPILYSGAPTGTISGLTTASFSTWVGGPATTPTHFVGVKIYASDPSGPCNSDAAVAFTTLGFASCGYALQVDNVPFYDTHCDMCEDRYFRVEWNGSIDASLEIH